MATAISSSPLAPDPDSALTLNDILGHGSAVGFLRRALREDRLPQSILLTGPEGVGKKTLAFALMREVAARGEDPAMHRGSLKVARGTHPDLTICGSAASVSGQITIDAIREMEDWTATSPLEAPRKMILIAPAEAMNVAAANALLKLLEEPPRHVLLMLTASDPARLLPTIRSRCTPLQLDPLPPEDLVPWLVKQDAIGKGEAMLIARLAEGRPGRALAMLGSDLLECRPLILEELKLLKDNGFAVVFRVADGLGGIGGDLAGTLNTALLLLRDALLMKMDLSGVLNIDLKPALAELAEGLSPEALLAAADRLASAVHEVPRYYTPQARAHFLETLVVEIGRQFRQG
jgi:DNA polymerase-3 subunit delta'